MSAVIVVLNKVADFDTWKKGYDGHASAREHAGIKVTGLYRDSSNPNQVTMIADVANAEVVRDMFNNLEFIAVPEAVGVTSKAEVKYLMAV